MTMLINWEDIVIGFEKISFDVCNDSQSDIEISQNPRNLHIPNKKDPEEAICLNKASNGRELEPLAYTFAHFCLHKIELIEHIKYLIK